MAFSLEIYTPQEKFFEGEVDSINLDTLSGRIQILSRHISTVVGIKPCIMKIIIDEETMKFKVFDGILDFEKNKCKIFISKAERIS